MSKKLLLILFSLVLFFSLSAFCLIRSTGVANNGQNRCCGGLLRWWHPSTQPVRILIDEAGSPQAPGALTHEAVRAAMNTWNRVRSSYFRFADGGLTSQKTISGSDGRNILLFDRDGTNFPQGANALAFSRTFTVNDNLGYRCIDSDLVYNSRDFRFEVNPTENSFDIQAIATHELGHHLGLDHAGGGRDLTFASTGCGPVIPAATMYYSVGPRDTSKRSLELDDIAGVTAFYPKWTIAGAVYDNRNGQPFLNAAIELQGTQSPLDTILVSSINTGQTGFFTIPLLDSVATVSFCQFGYQS
ncbi:MAG: matrixin family metalloprotease, partial [bacterium]